MDAALEAWHAVGNRQVAEREHGRIRQFALRPVSAATNRWPLSESVPLPGEVWAWQQPDKSEVLSLPPGFTIRVGFAGRQLHLGHLGLARTAAQLAAAGGKVLIFDAGVSPGPMLSQFRTALRHYAQGHVDANVCPDGPELRRVQHQGLSTVRLDKLRRLYGWDEATPASALTDIASMLGFFFHTPDDEDQGQPGVALVDAMQAPHSALLPRVSRVMGLPAPTLLYRRLFPSLRRLGERGSVRDGASVVFADDDATTIRHKFRHAITGGRASAEQQRAQGGNPARCSAFAMIELLCPEETARTALNKCRSGQVLCSDCKSEHVESIASGLNAATDPPLRARQSPRVQAAVTASGDRLHQLPPRDANQLERLIAQHTGVTSEEVVVGSGSTQVMDWLFGMQPQGATVIATEPTFELYRQLADRHQLAYSSIRWDTATRGHDIPAMAEAIDDDTRLCVLDIPHAVSGVAAASLTDQLHTVAKALPPGAVLLLDMVCADYIRTPPEPAARLLEMHPNVVVCGSMSKAHCLLGARVGYALATPPVAKRLRDYRLPYAMNTMALSAAEAALGDDEARQRTVAASHEARNRLTAVLRQIGVHYAPTESNILLMDLGPLFEAVTHGLNAQGARYRDGRRWRLPGWMQVHLIDTNQIDPVIDVLHRVARGDNSPLC